MHFTGNPEFALSLPDRERRALIIKTLDTHFNPAYVFDLAEKPTSFELTSYAVLTSKSASAKIHLDISHLLIANRERDKSRYLNLAALHLRKAVHKDGCNWQAVLSLLNKMRKMIR